MKINNSLLIVLIASIALVLAVYIYSNNTPFKQCLHAGAQLYGADSYQEMTRLDKKSATYKRCVSEMSKRT